jgi:hypothetical protein
MSLVFQFEEGGAGHEHAGTGQSEYEQEDGDGGRAIEVALLEGVYVGELVR